jgi:hypothetical protein
MANDLWGGEVSKEQAVHALASITGQNFPDLGAQWADSRIGGALSNANGTDRGPLGSCVFQVSGESGNRCLDNLTEDQARDGFSGRWDQFRSCDLRESERVRPTSPAEPEPPASEEPAEGEEPAAPRRAPRKAKARPAKPAKKKVVVKKRTPARAAKRAPAAARTKPKKKVAAKAKRRPVKAAAKKKVKRTVKKAKRR